MKKSIILICITACIAILASCAPPHLLPKKEAVKEDITHAESVVRQWVNAVYQWGNPTVMTSQNVRSADGMSVLKLWRKSDSLRHRWQQARKLLADPKELRIDLDKPDSLRSSNFLPNDMSMILQQMWLTLGFNVLPESVKISSHVEGDEIVVRTKFT